MGKRASQKSGTFLAQKNVTMGKRWNGLTVVSWNVPQERCTASLAERSKRNDPAEMEKCTLVRSCSKLFILLMFDYACIGFSAYSLLLKYYLL